MRGKPFVVGIAGGSASGKTTLCENLERELKDFRLFVIHMDHYFKPDAVMPRAEAFVTGKIYADHNHPETVDIAALSGDLRRIIEQNEHDAIIVEGHLVLWYAELSAMLDFKVFVDCRADERIVRRLRRNMRYGLTFDEIADVYLDMVRYRHEEYCEPSKNRADIIINGSNPTEISLEVLVGYIKGKIK
jgi:uridine kinase